MEFDINYWAVLVAAIAQFVIGMAWYSPMLFGKTWMKEMGLTDKDMKASKEKGMMKEMVIALISALVMAYVLSHVTWMSGEVLGSADWIGGLTTGFWMWLGFWFMARFGRKRAGGWLGLTPVIGWWRYSLWERFLVDGFRARKAKEPLGALLYYAAWR